jgi:hypothetical protein
MRLEINSSGTPAIRRLAGARPSTATRINVRPEIHAAEANARALSDLSLSLDQRYFWTLEWQQKERLADWDILIGAVYRPKDVEDLIRSLQEDD